MFKLDADIVVSFSIIFRQSKNLNLFHDERIYNFKNVMCLGIFLVLSKYNSLLQHCCNEIFGVSDYHQRVIILGHTLNIFMILMFLCTVQVTKCPHCNNKNVMDLFIIKTSSVIESRVIKKIQ